MRFEPATIAWICNNESVSSFTRKYKNPRTPLHENVSLQDDPRFENIALSKNLFKFWNEQIHKDCVFYQFQNFLCISHAWAEGCAMIDVSQTTPWTW